MPYANTDTHYRLSGGAANTLAAAAIGGAKSATAVTSLFDDVSADEAISGESEFRCIYVHNAHSTITLVNPFAFIGNDLGTPNMSYALGLGTSALNAGEQAVANENTSPVGVTFLPAANKAGGVALGDIPPGQSRAVWVRRTVAASAPAAAQGNKFSVVVEGEAAA